MGEHGSLERLQLDAGIEAELVEQVCAGLTLGLQGVDLTAGPIEGDDELGPKSFAHRMTGHQLDEVCNDVGMVAGRQLAVDEALVRGQLQLLQAGDRVPGEPVVLEVRQRRAAPETDCGTKSIAGGGVVAFRRRRATLGDESLEAAGVDHVGIDEQDVPRAVPADDVSPEDPAEVRDERLQSVRRVRRLIGAPQLLDQPVVGHAVRRGEREQCQQRLQLHSGDRRGAAVGSHLDRAEERHKNGAFHMSVPSATTLLPVLHAGISVASARWVMVGA